MDIDISNINLVLIFAGIMAGAIVLYFAIFRKNWGQQINAIASIVTVIGVLGTFFGIAIGLYHFDTSNIEESVPKLLDGLKFAFVTSILGISLSTLLKFFALFYALYRIKPPAPAGKTVDDLAKVLDDLKGLGYETKDSLHAIERSLTRDGDSTVLTQLQELRTTVSDKQDALIRSFNEFTEDQNETSRAIKGALTEDGGSTVLTQLQELRTTVSGKQDALIHSFDKFAERMAKDNIDALIKALEGVIKDFNDKIKEQFGDNFKELNEAVGRINEWQEQYRQQMKELAAEFEIASESIKRSHDSLKNIAERSGAIVSNSEKLDPILQAVQHRIENLGEYLTAFKALADKAENAFPKIEGRLNQFTDALQKTIEDSHASLNDALQKEFTTALRSLGTDLASLSAKFVEDFTPLTNKLRAVIKIADDIPPTDKLNAMIKKVDALEAKMPK